MNKSLSTTNTSFPSYSTIIERSWKLFKEKFWTIIGVYLIPTVFSILYSLFLLSDFVKGESFEAVFVQFVLTIASFYLSIMSHAALFYAIIQKTSIIKAYQQAWNVFLPFLWIDVLAVLRVLVGLLLLIIPGIYMVVQYSFASFILLAENKRGMEALSTSAAYVEGKWWKVFYLFLGWIIISLGVTYGINMLEIISPSSAIILSYLIFLFITPFIATVTYIFYIYCKPAKK